MRTVHRPVQGHVHGTLAHSPKKPASVPPGCDYQGQTCRVRVPKSLVLSGQASNLKQDECPTNAASYLCVPNEYPPGSTTPVQTCTAGLLGRGRA